MMLWHDQLQSLYGSLPRVVRGYRLLGFTLATAHIIIFCLQLHSGQGLLRT